jgi:hypothetical protein
MDEALRSQHRRVELHVNHACAHALAYSDIELGPTVAFLRATLTTTAAHRA